MKYALLLMGHVNDPACGEDGGASPEEFFAFDEEITKAGIVVNSFALEDERAVVMANTDHQAALLARHRHLLEPAYAVPFPPSEVIDAARARPPSESYARPVAISSAPRLA